MIGLRDFRIESIETFIYVFVRNGKTKVLSHFEISNEKHNKLVKQKWSHTATLNSINAMKYLLSASDEEIINTINDYKGAK